MQADGEEAEGGRGGPEAGSCMLGPGVEETGRGHAGLAFDAATLLSPERALSPLTTLLRADGQLMTPF